MSTRQLKALADDSSALADCTFETVLELAQPFRLECGQILPSARIAIRLSGPEAAPVVVVLGGISAHRCPVALPGEARDGWWQGVLGEQGVDILCSHRVLGLDYLGGGGATTAPCNWGDAPESFPAIDSLDQARIVVAALDALGLARIEAVIGASYGGMVALHLASRFGDRVSRAMVIASAHRPEPMALARRYVQKKILALAAQGGVSDRAAVEVARALAMTTYRSPAEFRKRFGGPGGADSLASYLDHHGDKFAARFDAVAYARLIDSIDTHAVNPAAIRTPLTLVGFDSDEICPPSLMRELSDLAPGTRGLVVLPSIYGHDAFLCERDGVAGTIAGFLNGAET